MRSFAQLLTTPTADTPGTTLLLHFDAKRYLLGSLAEGAQRAAGQMGARLLKVSDAFVTGRAEWANTGGLVGMILTLADAGASSREAALDEARRRAVVKARRAGVGEEDEERMAEFLRQEAKDVPVARLQVVGPRNLNHTLATARRFVFRKGMPVDVHEVDEREETRRRRGGEGEGEGECLPAWADENIKVWAMSIAPSTTPALVEGGGGTGDASPRKRSFGEMRDAPASAESASGDVAETADVTESERGVLTAKAVVGEMFNSSWRLDTLFPTRLADVRLPATVFVRDPATKKIEKYKGPLPSASPLPSTYDPDLEVLVRKPWPGALVESLAPTEPARESVCYIVKNHTQRGKFDPAAAKKLKVKKGQDYGKLSNGQSVVNEDGETITPEQVLGPSKEGGGLAVVDLPDTSYIDALVTRPEWQNSEIMAGVGAVVWILGSGVAEDTLWQDFVTVQLAGLEHVLSSPDHCANYIALDSAATATLKLREVDPARYNVPVHSNVAALPTTLPNMTVAARGLVVQLEPKLEVLTKDVVPAMEPTIPELPEEVLTLAREAQEKSSTSDAQLDAWAASLPDGNTEITTLGTGSALPSKYRNVSATLLRIPGWGALLFDCGENTLGQLKRVFAPDELKEVLSSLRCIFISHMHADHHLGTVSVIRAWYQQVHGGRPLPTSQLQDDVKRRFDEPRLAVVAEPAMCSWLNEYAAVEDYGFSRIAPLSVTPAYPDKGVASRLGWFVPPTDLADLSSKQRQQKMDSLLVEPAAIGFRDVQAVLVRHCHGARAISVTLPSGFKASYSGDCRPSKAFSQIGQGSTVCIHEATFDDELDGDARAKNHSTTSEALGVAQAMGARTCVLTHFSQRYQKLPVLEYDGSGNGATNGAHEPGAEDEDEEDIDAEIDAGDDAMETLPDQPTTTSAQTGDGSAAATSNGTAGPTASLLTADQYELPAKSTKALQKHADGAAGEAVKFKLTTDMKVCVAFDYMRVKVGDIAQMQHFTAPLLKLFAEEERVKEEAKAVQAAEKPEAKPGKQAKQNRQKTGKAG